MMLFAKIVNGFHVLTIFTKRSILDVLLDVECTYGFLDCKDVLMELSGVIYTQRLLNRKI